MLDLLLSTEVVLLDPKVLNPNPFAQNFKFLWIGLAMEIKNFEGTGVIVCLVQIFDTLKGHTLQSKYKFVLKAVFLYADIPAKNDFSEKFIF